MSSSAFVNPWRPPLATESYANLIHDAMSGNYLPAIVPDNPQILPSAVAKGILFLAPLMAPVLFRASKADAAPVTPNSGNELVTIGDSLSVGLQNVHAEQTYRDAGFNPTVFSAYGGRSLVFSGCDVVPVTPACVEYSDGLREVRKAGPEIDRAKYVRLGLGTNDRLAATEANATRVLDAVFEEGSKDGVPPIVILPQIMGNNPKIHAPEKNVIFQNLSDKYAEKGLQVVVPAYAAQVEKVIRPAGGVAKDGVHLTGRGYRMLADFDTQVFKSLGLHQNPTVTPPSKVTEQPQAPITITPSQTSGNSRKNIVDVFSAVPESKPKNLALLGLEVVALEEFRAPKVSLDLIPFEAVTQKKSDIAQVFSVLPVTTPTNKILVSESTTPLQQEVPPIVTSDSLKPSVPTPNLDSKNQATLEIAKNAGIFYDAKTGRAMTYVRSFFGADDTPTMVQGFGDFRDLPQTGPYLHGNTDWHAAEGTPFVSSVPAKVIRYDDPNPGQKKGVGNALVLLMGKDENGRRIAIQSTHFSDMVVNSDDIVMPGQLLAHAGHTGITTGPHFSVGMTNKSVKPYTNRANSLDPTLYYNFNYTCSPDALDDPEEVCLMSDNPLAVPIHEDVLAYLGIPEYLFVDLAANEPIETTSVEVPDNTEQPVPSVIDVLSAPIDTVQDFELPYVDSGVIDYVEPSESPELPTVDELPPEQVEPPTLIDAIEPEQPSLPVDSPPDLPSVDDSVTATGDDQAEIPVDPAAPADPIIDSGTIETPPEEVGAPPVVVPVVPPVPPAETIGTNSKLTYEDVSIVLPNAQMENIRLYTPLIVAALQEQGIADDQMICYTLATIQVETSGMIPIAEYSRGKGMEYGVPDPVTGQTYYGRGFIQLTWKGHYENYGAALGVDLLNNPDLALEPTISARILALYMKNNDSRIREALNGSDLKRARQIVNGRAAHGLEGFTNSYNACQAILSQKQG